MGAAYWFSLEAVETDCGPSEVVTVSFGSLGAGRLSGSGGICAMRRLEWRVTPDLRT